MAAMCQAQRRTRTKYCGKFSEMMVVKFADDYIGGYIGVLLGEGEINWKLQLRVERLGSREL